MTSGLTLAFGYHQQRGLEDWRQSGCLYVEFWCLGPGCNHMERVHIEKLIGKAKTSTPFVELACKARCSACGRWGCHVQPADPPKPEHRDYAIWLMAEIARRKDFILLAEAELRGMDNA
ncbi:hypothetical protein [Azospirillum sp. B506]|uniref:hypothetical protein n=1 Tax=Azospirillum sp. B506 TaxID=137721 RepID=UPI000349428C|nr:hypothetical protein [Azospirillum sp. B506]